MKSIFILFLSALLMVSPVSAIELEFVSVEAVETETPVVAETPRAGITYKLVEVSPAVLDAGRVNKQVIFRGNKSARFGEFDNLALAPQVTYAKGLLNSEKLVDGSGVVNYADLPDVNAATAVSQVETKVTARTANNPAITGYGRNRGDVYGALRLKRAQDAKTEAALQEKLAQFQATPSRMQEKIVRTTVEPKILN